MLLTVHLENAVWKLFCRGQTGLFSLVQSVIPSPLTGETFLVASTL